MKKGFTLIELLIVIGIIAVLSVVVVLTLNPAELLRQARDSTRISDLGTIKSALALYLADVSGGNYDIGNGANCYVHSAAANYTATNCGYAAGATAIRFGSSTAATTAYNVTSSVVTNVGGGGWLPVKFTLISSGAPVSALPVDPAASIATNLYYAYRPGGANGATCTTGNTCVEYELNANMESSKFGRTGSSDVETGDGGNDANLFEVGTSSGLQL